MTDSTTTIVCQTADLDAYDQVIVERSREVFQCSECETIHEAGEHRVFYPLTQKSVCAGCCKPIVWPVDKPIP